MLLERLFAFIKVEPGNTEKERLNAVLSGYFGKMVTSLINRKQNELIQYIIKEDTEIIDYLLKHVY